MKREEKEQKLRNTTVYLEKALEELKQIPCECREEDYCDRCCLVDDVKNIYTDVKNELKNFTKS